MPHGSVVCDCHSVNSVNNVINNDIDDEHEPAAAAETQHNVDDIACNAAPTDDKRIECNHDINVNVNVACILENDNDNIDGAD